MPILNVGINASQAKAGADVFNNALNSMLTSINPVTTAIAGIISYKTVESLTETADKYTTLAAQLKYVTGSSQDASFAQEDLYQMSQKTGTSVTANAQALMRLAQASDMTHLSLSENIEVIGGLNALMIKTGTGTAEASTAMIQLTQALGSGALQGDEFRSIMEASPALMREFAKSLGVGVGQLKAMAADGKITTEVMTTALKNIAAEGKASMDELPKTVASGWQKVVNAFEKAWDRINDESGIMGFIFDALEKLAAWIEEKSPVFSNWVTELVTNIQNSWPTIDQMIENFITKLTNLWTNIQQRLPSMETFFTNLASTVEGAGRVVTGVLELIDSLVRKWDSVKSIANIATLGIVTGGAAAAGTLAGGGSMGDAWNAWGEAVDNSGDFNFDKRATSGKGQGGGLTQNLYFNNPLSRSDIVNISLEQARQGMRI